MQSKRRYFRILGLLLAMPLLVVGARAAQYQGGGPGGPGGGGRRGPMSPDDRLKQMTKDLNLTSDQQSKIKPILVDEQKKSEAARNDSSGDRQAMRGTMQKIQQDTNDQIRALLTDTQKDTFDKMEKERQTRMQNGPGGGMGGNRGGGNPPPAPDSGMPPDAGGE